MNMVDKIKAAAKSKGYLIDTYNAKTGTHYLTCTRDGVELIIRVADHSECHAPSRGHRQISISPDESSYADAIAALDNPLNVSVYGGMSKDEQRMRTQYQMETANKKRKRQEWLDNRATAVIVEMNAKGIAVPKTVNRPQAAAIASQLSEGLKVSHVYYAITGRTFNHK